MTRKVFVFGSNLGGFHGAGSAKAAMDDWGAQYGLGVGMSGDSYAIPTKDSNIECLPLETIQLHVEQFVEYAEDCEQFADAYRYAYPDRHDYDPIEFHVVDIGCGLAGFTPEEIAPMFEGAPSNCVFSERFQKIIDQLKKENENGEDVEEECCEGQKVSKRSCCD